MRCLQYQHENRAGLKFCNQCGVPLSGRCEQCGFEKGRSHDTRPQCKPLIAEMPSAPLRLKFEAWLAYQLETAKTLGFDQVGLPIS
jgi:hypothetical protein